MTMQSTQPTWTTQDKVGLGLNIGSALFGAMGQNRQQQGNERQTALQQVLAALRNRSAVMAEQQQARQNQAVQFADRSPLGGEQQYIQRQKMMQAILPQLGRNQIKSGDPAIAALQGDAGGLGRILGSNPGLGAAFSDNAIQRAITDRRNALTNIDPTVQYQHLGDYGFADNGFNDETQQLRNAVLGRRKATEDAMMGMADEELALARNAQAQEGGAGGGKKSPWWKKLAKVGLIAGGALASAATGGAASPLLMAAIGAGTGAASGALDGGWKGALMGGAAGGLGGGLLGGAGGAAGAKGLSGAVVKNALLNPQTIGKMAGAGIGGRAGQIIELGSNFIPRNAFGGPKFTGGGFEGNLAEHGMLPGGQFMDEVKDQGWQSILTGGRAQEALARDNWARQIPDLGIEAGLGELDTIITGLPSKKRRPKRYDIVTPSQPVPDYAALGGPDARMSAARPTWFGPLLDRMGYSGGESGLPASKNPLASAYYTAIDGARGLADILEEFGMPGASAITGHSRPDSIAGQVINTPIGSLMLGGIAAPAMSGRAVAARAPRAPRPTAPPRLPQAAPPMGGATGGANPLAGWQAGNPGTVGMSRPSPFANAPMQGTASSESMVARILKLIGDQELHPFDRAQILANPVSQSAIRALPSAGGGGGRLPANVQSMTDQLRAILLGGGR